MVRDEVGGEAAAGTLAPKQAAAVRTPASARVLRFEKPGDILELV
jgi:hypothetical protein